MYVADTTVGWVCRECLLVHHTPDGCLVLCVWRVKRGCMSTRRVYAPMLEPGPSFSPKSLAVATWPHQEFRSKSVSGRPTASWCDHGLTGSENSEWGGGTHVLDVLIQLGVFP